jgi:hypothetical protein
MPQQSPPPRIPIAVILFPRIKPEGESARSGVAKTPHSPEPPAGFNPWLTPRQALARARAIINRRKPARFRRP